MSKEENVKPLVDAARIAAAVSDSGFWKELEERMNLRDEANKALVEPRKLAH